MAAVLEGLALKDVAGILEIDGNPDGAIYLDHGHITHARSSWTPNLMTRLRGTLRPAAEARELLCGEDRPEADLGAVLIARSYLTEGGLQAILRSIVVDAIMVLTVPLAEQASVAGIRFESAKKHWAESFCRLPVHVARAEAIGRAERMASALPLATRQVRNRHRGGQAHGAASSHLAPMPADSLKRVLEGLRQLN